VSAAVAAWCSIVVVGLGWFVVFIARAFRSVPIPDEQRHFAYLAVKVASLLVLAALSLGLGLGFLAWGHR
jgi:hypothetical protein